MVGFVISLCFLSLTLLVEVEGVEKCNYVSRIRSGKSDYYVTGLFPMYNTAPSRYNSNGLQYSEVIKYTLNLANKNSSYKIGYVFYDTCGEAQLDITTEIITDMLLGDSFYFWQKNTTSEIDMRSNKEGTCYCQSESYGSRHLGIVGPASSSVSRKTSNFLSNEKLQIISYGSTSPTLSDKIDYPNFMRTIPSDTFQVQVIIDLILHFNWTYISIVASDNSYGRDGTDKLLELFKKHNICVGVQIFFGVPYSDVEIKKVVKTLLDSSTAAEVIVLFALSTPSKMLFDHASNLKLFKKTWILTEGVTGRKIWSDEIEPNVLTGAFAITPYTGSDNGFENYFWNLSYAEADENPYLKIFFNIHGINSTNSENVTLKDFKSKFKGDKIGNTRNAIVAYIVALEEFIKDQCEFENCTSLPSLSNRELFNEKYVQPVAFTGLLGETVTFDENGDITTAVYKIQNMQRKDNSFVLHPIAEWTQKKGLTIDVQRVVWATHVKPRSQCSDTCKPGFYTLYDKSKPCCWDCVKCQKGLVKIGHGHGNCTSCPKNSVADNGKKCVKLELYNHRIASNNGVIMLSLSVFGMISSCFVLFTFLKYRNRVIIRSGNTRFSIIQIVMQLLLFCSLLLVFAEITDAICAIKLYLNGLLLVITFSIILIKAELLLRIFNAKFRINKTHARVTTSMEFGIVACATLTFSLIQIILYQERPIVVKEIFDFANKRKEITCDFDMHLSATVIYLILLSLICGFQAFRARKLPDIFNEGSFIMYAVFVSSVNMVLIIFLTQYAQDATTKTFVRFIFIFSTNFFLLSVMFGYKVWVIWFQTESTQSERRHTMTFDSTLEGLDYKTVGTPRVYNNRSFIESPESSTINE
ncbi:metabotropic glutamate receptor 8-like [Hydractinia symbiolongicarpus]|uniref:metabotropic glutamate receptor 8-like n=1 Tax=Hydractinia symbiolongicarpus TaxID=13093 RepID=UPI00254AA8CD|nr:metabotropic glutamate receptor 8-like [Hydractinia symbiolongicarpus]